MFQAIWLVWQFTPFSDILFLQSHVLPKFRVRILENPSVDVFKVKKTLQSIENSFSDLSLQNFFFTLIICWGYSLQKEWNYDLPCSKFCKELTFVHILCTDTYPFIISTGIQPENIIILFAKTYLEWAVGWQGDWCIALSDSTNWQEVKSHRTRKITEKWMTFTVIILYYG